MENVSKFLQASRALGVPECDLFETVDLYEEKDMGLVVRCLDALGRSIQKTVPDFTPQFGVKAATENKRVFNEEQLAGSRGVMSKLMMGSATVMERAHVDLSNNINWGADKVCFHLISLVPRTLFPSFSPFLPVVTTATVFLLVHGTGWCG